jgi:hypothetical protein
LKHPPSSRLYHSAAQDRNVKSSLSPLIPLSFTPLPVAELPNPHSFLNTDHVPPTAGFGSEIPEVARSFLKIAELSWHRSCVVCSPC